MEKIGEFYSGLKTYFFKDCLLNEGFLQAIGTFYTGVLNDKDKVGLVNRPGYLHGVKAKCDPEYGTYLSIDEDTWHTSDIELPFNWCYSDIDAEMKRNQDLFNLSTNDAFLKLIRDFMGIALVNNAFCLAMFGDTTSSENKLKLVDGILKKAITAASNNAKRRTTVTTQTDVAMRSGMTAVETIEKMIMDAPIELRMAPDAEIIMTQRMWDAINYNISVSKGIYIETQWNTLFNGFKETQYRGYRIVVIPALDDIIDSISGNVLEGFPYFALMTTKSNICFGSTNNTEAGISSIDIWEERKEHRTYADAIYSLGTLLPQSNMIQICY